MVAWGVDKNLKLQAATPPGGFPLQNGTPLILSWTAPNDGQLHRAIVTCNNYIFVTEVGGIVAVFWELPSNNFIPVNVSGGSVAGPGFDYTGPQAVECMVQAGGSVQVSQQTPLTSGSATMWAEIWAS